MYPENVKHKILAYTLTNNTSQKYKMEQYNVDWKIDQMHDLLYIRRKIPITHVSRTSETNTI